MSKAVPGSKASPKGAAQGDGANPIEAAAPTTPSQERAMRTRALIIERAAEAFGQLGFEGASLNDIVKATGLSKGAFYHHFSSKDELAMAVFRAKQGELISRMRAEASPQANSLLTLAELFRIRARVLNRDPALGCFLRLASELALRAGPGSEFAASYELPIETVAKLIRQGQAEGVVKKSHDPRAAAEAVFAASLGTDELSRAQSNNTDLEQRTSRWLKVILLGLAEAPAAEAGPKAGRAAGSAESKARRKS